MTTQTTRPDLSQSQRIVIKTGSALVTDVENSQPRTAWMATLAADIAALRKTGKSVILVSSGAVSLGRNILNLKGRPLELDEKQAAAACGQVALMDAWRTPFAAHGLHVAQLLLTLDTSEHRNRYLNARSTLETLLSLGVIPIINENDTVATAELKFGDNDRLAARVAEMAGADTLVILSDIKGLYTADPSKNPNATLIPLVSDITPDIERMAGKPTSSVGSGGMITKIQAAKIAHGAGCSTVIAAGRGEHPIRHLLEQNEGTWFTASTSPSNARRRWIAGGLRAAGSIVVDAGAEKALQDGKSLLAAGVTTVEGDFGRGEAVHIRSAQGKLLGKGLIAYTSAETRLIQGRKSDAFESLIGYKGKNALIHRDDLVLE
ncbi:MAG: glutamate 5-kinase [Alphaproteobacteria bacterium]|nr:glutamate 5-kinase [Alphaproteobacteria bacterium]